jgi:hypothetical protein
MAEAVRPTMETIMTKMLALSTLPALAILAVIAVGAPAQAEAIPPNCTLDPFTHKQVCHIWPTCTLNPFTHKMNCPVPKSGSASLSAQ